MRRLFIIFLIILLVLQLSSCLSKKVIYKEGTYEGVGEGHVGKIKIRLVTDKYSIKEIKIIEDEEIPIIAEKVYNKIPQQVIKSNSGDVEVVTGATYTSRGLIEAINDALNKAKIKNNNN
ncbi:fumarate reductase flavoprotein subunit/urocanate reductase [Caloramator quimbayensis]|uniref:Fumarate reductase flavoprotein subunit/urocanate reductase n=1 Tax=Caloramator quimbayensis TaxID=1147123 RepID=A0A1T4WQK0_9CLOT|nr:FMN-binding protein [Caloramator quimbayensis]SKA79135.1 fumarate reductase flavoprotein subunit/urocanate reductase [Caloramator quimbayensis]